MTPAEVIASVTSQQHHLDQSRVNWEGDPLCCCGASPDDWDNHWAEVAVNALAAAGLVVVSAELLDALTDTDECWFDHHGGCQAHGFLSLEPGERCPHAEAREVLAALPERRTDA